MKFCDREQYIEMYNDVFNELKVYFGDASIDHDKQYINKFEMKSIANAILLCDELYRRDEKSLANKYLILFFTAPFFKGVMSDFFRLYTDGDINNMCVYLVCQEKEIKLYDLSFDLQNDFKINIYDDLSGNISAKEENRNLVRSVMEKAVFKAVFIKDKYANPNELILAGNPATQAMNNIIANNKAELKKEYTKLYYTSTVHAILNRKKIIEQILLWLDCLEIFYNTKITEETKLIKTLPFISVYSTYSDKVMDLQEVEKDKTITFKKD